MDSISKRLRHGQGSSFVFREYNNAVLAEPDAEETYYPANPYKSSPKRHQTPEDTVNLFPILLLHPPPTQPHLLNKPSHK